MRTIRLKQQALIVALCMIGLVSCEMDYVAKDPLIARAWDASRTDLIPMQGSFLFIWDSTINKVVSMVEFSGYFGDYVQNGDTFYCVDEGGRGQNAKEVLMISASQGKYLGRIGLQPGISQLAFHNDVLYASYGYNFYENGYDETQWSSYNTLTGAIETHFIRGSIWEMKSFADHLYALTYESKADKSYIFDLTTQKQVAELKRTSGFYIVGDLIYTIEQDNDDRSKPTSIIKVYSLTDGTLVKSFTPQVGEYVNDLIPYGDYWITIKFDLINDPPSEHGNSIVTVYKNDDFDHPIAESRPHARPMYEELLIKGDILYIRQAEQFRFSSFDLTALPELKAIESLREMVPEDQIWYDEL